MRRGVYSPQDRYAFPATHVGTSSTLKVNIRNSSSDMHEVRRAICSRWARASTLGLSVKSKHTLLLHAVGSNRMSASIESY